MSSVSTGFSAAAELEKVIEENREVIVNSIQGRIKSNYDRRFNGADIYQIGCANVAKKIHEFRGSTKNELAFWLGKAAHCALSNEIDKVTAAKRSIRSTGSIHAGMSNGESDQLNDMCEDEEAAEAVKRLLSFVNELPERQRMAVHLRFFSHLSIDEIAERMNTSKEAAKGCLKRGMQILREKTINAPCLSDTVINKAATMLHSQTVA